MSDCQLLEGKTEEESRVICLSCRLPDCCLTQFLRCKKCGGNVVYDEGEFICLQCGAPHTRVGELIQPCIGQSKQKSKLDRVSTPDNSISTPDNSQRKEKTVTPIPSPSGHIPRVEKVMSTPPQEKREYIQGITSRLSLNGTWFAPREISFKSEHILFLITHLSLLREGIYPPNPAVTGYTDSPIPRKRETKSHQAYFARPVEFAAECDKRLELAGLDGLMLEYLYVDDPADKQWRMEHLANMLAIDLPAIEHRIDTVLKFISGWKRKRTDFKMYRRQWKYKVKSQSVPGLAAPKL